MNDEQNEIRITTHMNDEINEIDDQDLSDV